MKCRFYCKIKKKVCPVEDLELNRNAKIKLDEIFKKRNEYRIPSRYIQNWHEVALYDPKGNLETAKSILINPKDGAYHLKNKINALTGKEWVKFSCSWFIFNALKADLIAEKELDSTTEHHPATFSPTMISDFVKFFTKEGDKVLDPFCGIGSTLEACKRTNRLGYGIELNSKYYNLVVKRVPEFKKNIYNFDSTKISELDLPKIDFCISSPPYWDILNRSTRNFKSDRVAKDLDVMYSNEGNDIGNISDYDHFLEKLTSIYIDLYKFLKKDAYIVIIIKNIKKSGKLYPLAWDLAKNLSRKYVLKDEKIWIQDKIGLAPYGYPFSWASNIIHHYCLILRKEND